MSMPIKPEERAYDALFIRKLRRDGSELYLQELGGHSYLADIVGENTTTGEDQRLAALFAESLPMYMLLKRLVWGEPAEQLAKEARIILGRLASTPFEDVMYECGLFDGDTCYKTEFLSVDAQKARNTALIAKEDTKRWKALHDA